MIKKLCGSLVILSLMLALKVSALVLVDVKQPFPAEWPDEIKSLQSQSTTYVVAAANHETVYEIWFDDRAQFEKAWPAIQSLGTSESVLTIQHVAPQTSRTVFSSTRPTVRIKTPSNKLAGKIYKNGKLAEYVANLEKKQVGVDASEWEKFGFIFRQRIDFELVVDDKVIDLKKTGLKGMKPGQTIDLYSYRKRVNK